MEKEYWLVILAAILYGTITAGGQFFVNLGLSLFEISLYPIFFMTLLFLPIVFIRRQYIFKKNMLLFFVIYGLIGALAELAQFGGIVLGVPVGVVALLLYSQPIWTTIFGRLMLNEQINLRKIIAVMVALLGTALLLKSWNIESVFTKEGIISSLLGGIFLSLWIIWGRKSGISKQHYVTTTIGWGVFSTIWLLLLWPIVGFFANESNIIRLSVHFPIQYWLYLVFFAFIAGVIPSLCFFRGVQKIHASIAGIILLLEPASAIVLASILFTQPINLNIVSGGALILFSNYLVIREH